ncbi:MAG TPA: acyl-CoA dehydrogenase family protein, partial [Novosphingobium sp.]|nr:acyl-CoA dehydrogenase family protein [Novosphingobium sp.]
MEFAFTEEQEMIAETVNGFFAEHATSERTRAAMAGEGIDRALWGAFCTELGMAGVAVPEALGGAGLGLVELAIVAQAAGGQVAAVPLLGHAMVARALAAGGSAQQQAQWLPQLLSGAAIAAFAQAETVTEAGGALSLVADFVAHGALADLFLVAAGKGAWLVERNAAGLSVSAHVTMDQTRPLATLALAGTRAQELA